MGRVKKIKVIPEKSAVLNGFERLDYHDTFQIEVDTKQSAEDIARELMVMPKWVDTLFGVCNKVVGLFGLKTKSETDDQNFFFKVIEKNENEIIMGEEDKHLCFRASIMNDRSTGIVSLITVVQFYNVGGRIYFLPVKPFHKIIMKTLLKKYWKKNKH